MCSLYSCLTDDVNLHSLSSPLVLFEVWEEYLSIWEWSSWIWDSRSCRAQCVHPYCKCQNPKPVSSWINPVNGIGLPQDKSHIQNSFNYSQIYHYNIVSMYNNMFGTYWFSTGSHYGNLLKLLTMSWVTWFYSTGPQGKLHWPKQLKSSQSLFGFGFLIKVTGNEDKEEIPGHGQSTCGYILDLIQGLKGEHLSALGSQPKVLNFCIHSTPLGGYFKPRVTNFFKGL